MGQLRPKPKIHIGDWVTCSESRCENMGFLNVVGIKRFGELAEVGGLWVLKDCHTGEEFEMIGCYITVWKPLLSPETKDDKDLLWDTCKTWIDKYKPSCPESLMQVDDINLACPDLAEEVCNIIGYSGDKDEH